MSKNNMPSQILENPVSVIDRGGFFYVPHDMRYHAEIQYEGEIAMRYVCAAGETLEELARDISYELRKVKHRLPQIVHVEDCKNGELITKDFVEDFNNGVYNEY